MIGLLKEVEEYASRGLTMDQIAACMGIGRSTLYVYKNEYPEFLDAIKRGGANGIKEVTNALFENAISGNIGAQCFYLKNRDTENWSDRQEEVVTLRRLTANLLNGKGQRIHNDGTLMDDDERPTGRGMNRSLKSFRPRAIPTLTPPFYASTSSPTSNCSRP